MELMTESITVMILEKKKEFFLKCQFSGVTIMIWGWFSFNGVCSLGFISTKMNSDAYKEVLETHLLPIVVDLISGK